jgi:LysR family glycine cleavage system transcriptional activator
MTRILPSFRSLRALEAVVRHGNVVRAAEELAVTPGALSKHLGQLARDLAVPLFEPGHRLAPTPEGRELAASVGEAVALLREACERATAYRARGVVTVLANASLAMHWLVPRVFAAQAAIGGRVVRVHAVHSTDDWRQMSFDLAIRRGETVPPGFVGRVLGRERLVLLASPRRAEALAAAGLVGLAGETLLTAATRRGEVEAWFALAGVAPPAEVRRLPHFYLAIEAALADQGVIVGPPWLATDLHHDRLIMPFPDRVALGTTLVGIRDPSRGDAAVHERLLSWITEGLALAPAG